MKVLCHQFFRSFYQWILCRTLTFINFFFPTCRWLKWWEWIPCDSFRNKYGNSMEYQWFDRPFRSLKKKKIESRDCCFFFCSQSIEMQCSLMLFGDNKAMSHLWCCKTINGNKFITKFVFIWVITSLINYDSLADKCKFLFYTLSSQIEFSKMTWLLTTVRTNIFSLHTEQPILPRIMLIEFVYPTQHTILADLDVALVGVNVHSQTSI